MESDRQSLSNELLHDHELIGVTRRCSSTATKATLDSAALCQTSRLLIERTRAVIGRTRELLKSSNSEEP